jgi:hypothetical protein
MANPTTNYGFVLPTSTDLVTDLPADFDVALQGVDTRLKALQPGTTLGDLMYASATANTNTRLGIGTTGQILSVVSGVPAWAAAPAGKIIQVLSTTKSDTFTTTSTSFTDITGLSVTITPTLSTSKILVFYNLSAGNSSGNIAFSRLMRGATAISVGDAASSRNQSSSDPFTTASAIIGTTSVGSFLDSPATTSATTYKMQGAQSGGTMYVNRSQADDDAFTRSRTVSTITVMEIGA